MRWQNLSQMATHQGEDRPATWSYEGQTFEHPWRKSEIEISDGSLTLRRGRTRVSKDLAIRDIVIGPTSEPGVSLIRYRDSWSVEFRANDLPEFESDFTSAHSAAITQNFNPPEPGASSSGAEDGPSMLTYGAVSAVLYLIVGIGLVAAGVGEIAFNGAMGILTLLVFGGWWIPSAKAWFVRRPGKDAGDGDSQRRSVTFFGYAAFSIGLVLGVGFAADWVGLRDSAFGLAMASAWVVAIGGLAISRTRILFDRIGVAILVAVVGLLWIGGQVVAVGWLTWLLLEGRLRLGVLWLIGLVAWYYFLFRQLKWLFEETVYAIRRWVDRPSSSV